MIPPAITPLTPDRELDRGAVGRLASHYLDGGASGVFLLGSSGEGPSLPPRIAVELIKTFVAEIDGKIPVLAGVAEVSTERTIDAARAARDAGADALVVMSPMYYNTEPDGPVIRHIEAVVAAIDLPIVLYNIPHLTHQPISPAVIDAVGDIEQVVGLKESSGDWEVYSVLADASQAKGLAVFQGAESLIARSLRHGAAGAVPGIANVAPRLASDLVDAGLGGDEERALRLQEELDRVCALYGYGFWLSSLKTAVAELGLAEATAGHALTPASSTGRREIASKLRALGLIADGARR